MNSINKISTKLYKEYSKYSLCNAIIDANILHIYRKTYLNVYTGDKNLFNKPVLVIIGKTVVRFYVSYICSSYI